VSHRGKSDAACYPSDHSLPSFFSIAIQHLMAFWQSVDIHGDDLRTSSTPHPPRDLLRRRFIVCLHLITDSHQVHKFYWNSPEMLLSRVTHTHLMVLAIGFWPNKRAYNIDNCRPCGSNLDLLFKMSRGKPIDGVMDAVTQQPRQNHILGIVLEAFGKGHCLCNTMQQLSRRTKGNK